MKQKNNEEMRRRRITLSDGRYLIFYEFVGTESAETKQREEENKTQQPKAQEKASV